MTDDNLPEVEPSNEPESEPLARLDFDHLWHLCGLKGAASEDFRNDVKSVMRSYRPGPDQFARIPAKKRQKHYNALEKALKNLREKLENLEPHIGWEMTKAAIDHEPAEFQESSMGSWYEGLSYSEYLADVLLEEMAQFSQIAQEARAENKAQRGKPKQNWTLERTIRGLGKVYEKHVGCKPMAGYRFNDLDESQPYQSPFLNFVQSTLWAFNDDQKPSSHAIGDAARRAFRLRK